MRGTGLSGTAAYAMVGGIATLATCLMATAADASDKPLYQPTPAWVKPAPSIDPATLKDDAPIFVTLDTQDRLEDGTVWAYRDVATRMASPEIVQQAGTVSLPWQPAKGDLIVHKLEIIRGAQHIDVLAGGKGFTVIRREQQLERYSIDGELTATMLVEGLQVGDVLRLAVTVSRHEESLGGAVQDATFLPGDPIRAVFARTRLIWPVGSDVKWKAAVAGSNATLTTANGERELLVMGVLPKAPELPGDAPPRFQWFPIVEASSFADWTAVSKIMAPLYLTDGLVKPGGDLAGQIAAIKAATPDPLHRAEAALELVQGKVRYLFNGLDKGNYVPQSPEQTWTLRYGDCKAKTVLLLAILRAMDIDAEPVLANLSLPDRIPDRLPSAGAFNHVLVRATIAGQVYWLDGTGTGARFADIMNVPALRWVLPLRATGAGLMAVPLQAPVAPPIEITVDIDQRAGVLVPAVVHLTLTGYGPVASAIGLARSQGSKDQKEKMVGGVLEHAVGGDVLLTGYTLSNDPATSTGTIAATGTVTTLWTKVDDRYRMKIDKTVSELNFDPDRARPAWQTIPVATGNPGAGRLSIVVHLPDGGKGYTLDGDTSIKDVLVATTIARTVVQGADTVRLDDVTAASGAEIAPADVPAIRARVALAKTRLLTIVAPVDLPSIWTVVKADRADGRLKPIMAAYTDAIANDPTEPIGYDNRANFLVGVYDWKAAIVDYDKAIALSPAAWRFNARAYVERILHLDAKALSDMQAAAKLEPGKVYIVSPLAIYMVGHGQREAAVGMVQQQIDAGGDSKSAFMSLKAGLLARAGDGVGAIAAINQAVTAKPGDPSLLNERCWLKGQLAVQLDTALKDCTKAIELSDTTSGAALDSRAMAYFRLNRFDDALADLDAALGQDPARAASLYLRGIILKRQGKTAQAAQDIDAAVFMSPLIAENYQPFGITP